MCGNVDDNAIYIDDGRKRIFFEIEGVNYSVNISIDELLMPAIKEIENFDYRGYVSSHLINAIDSQSKPTVEQVKSQNDNFYILIFDYFLADNTDFHAIYNEIDCNEVCERYTTAYCRYCLRNLPQASERVNESFAQIILSVSKMTANILENIDFSFLDLLTEKINAAMSWYASHADTIISGMKLALASLGEISQLILKGILESLQYIHVPEISDERKKELLESYENWGKYGWTVPPFADIDCFNNCPNTLIEADKIALQYCSKADMKILFSSIEEICVRKKDLREAICCYNAHQYKACALLLFSIIDSRLIRLQSKKTEKYSVGIGAIKKYKKVVEQQTSDSGKLVLLLCYENLFSCLFSVFDDTNNFSKKTTVINRNYLDHGMSYKAVRKKDCIKLFLLLYNLLEFIAIVQ